MNGILNLLAQAHEPPSQMEWVDRLARTPLSKLVAFIAVMTVIRALVVPQLMKMDRHMRFGSKFNFLKYANEITDALVYAGGLVFLVVRPFAIQMFFVPSESMLDTLRINDFLVGNKFIYRQQDPRPGEIVIFRPPPQALAPGDDKYFIKRCIGAPGDVIEIREGLLYRNGQLTQETYNTQGPSIFDFKLVDDHGKSIPVVLYQGLANAGQNLTVDAYQENPDDVERQKFLVNAQPAPVPPGFYLMLGDNRNHSLDGRGWGLVPRRNIIARAELMYRPPRSFAKLDHPVYPK